MANLSWCVPGNPTMMLSYFVSQIVLCFPKIIILFQNNLLFDREDKLGQFIYASKCI